MDQGSAGCTLGACRFIIRRNRTTSWSPTGIVITIFGSACVVSRGQQNRAVILAPAGLDRDQRTVHGCGIPGTRIG